MLASMLQSDMSQLTAEATVKLLTYTLDTTYLKTLTESPVE